MFVFCLFCFLSYFSDQAHNIHPAHLYDHTYFQTGFPLIVLVSDYALDVQETHGSGHERY